jgi:hypothetical protein
MASHLSARRCHACSAITVTFKSTDDSNPINLSNIFSNFVTMCQPDAYIVMIILRPRARMVKFTSRLSVLAEGRVFRSISLEWLILAKYQDIPCSALVNQDLNKGRSGVFDFLAKLL